MRLVVQRVSSAWVTALGDEVGRIGIGLLALVAIEKDDTPQKAQEAARRLIDLRIFSDSESKMNLSLKDVLGSVLLVSQFTLLADTSRGRRPSFVRAAPRELAEPLIQVLAEEIRAQGVEVAEGRFGAQMEVGLVNDGPVTLVLDA